MLAITAGLTTTTLWVVSYNVKRQIRESLREELRGSVKTYETFAQQREATMVRSAALLANLPNVRALMTTEDAVTIQDESANISRLSGSDLLVLGNRVGEVVGLQTNSNNFTNAQAASLLRNSVQEGETRNWWLGGGHLYEVWVQPIYFGSPGQGSVIGLLAVGHEIDDHVAQEFSNLVSSEIIFQSGSAMLASSLQGTGRSRFSWRGLLVKNEFGDLPEEFQLGNEKYLAMTVKLSSGSGIPVTLSVLKSLDKATVFLGQLNNILLGLGLLSVLAGGAFVFLLSHTFTRPLSNLVAGVRALEHGNFTYALPYEGKDEVDEVRNPIHHP